MNKVGKYALGEDLDELKLMAMVFELPEKDRMLMWVQGYIEIVIDKLPTYAKDILQDRKLKWDDTKEYVQNQILSIAHQKEYKEAAKGTRKEFANFIKTRYPQFQTLLFRCYDGKLNELDLRKFVYNRRFGYKGYLNS
jgi:hypothetical protein